MNRIEVQEIKIVSNATQNGLLRACVWSRQTICLVQKLTVLRKLVTLFRSLGRLALAIDGSALLREVRQSIRQTTIHFGTAT
jgi:hypothetical protein